MKHKMTADQKILSLAYQYVKMPRKARRMVRGKAYQVMARAYSGDNLTAISNEWDAFVANLFKEHGERLLRATS